MVNGLANYGQRDPSVFYMNLGLFYKFQLLLFKDEGN
jgi:hypothetical protein